MNNIPQPEPAAAPLPQELAEVDRKVGLNEPQRRDEPHSGEGMASILRRLSFALLMLGAANSLSPWGGATDREVAQPRITLQRATA